MSIRQDLYKGVLYTAIAKYSGIVVQIIVTAILARLLTPEDFAIIAIATVIIYFFDILSDIGIGPAVVQNKELSRKDLTNIFSLSIFLGILLSLIFFLTAIPISNYYKQDNLVSICRWLSIPVLFHCLSIVPKNLLYKSKNFKKVGYISLAAQSISGILSIFAAYNGAGLYALVLSQIISSFCLFLFFYFFNPLRISITGGRQSINKILSFSMYQFLFNLINYFSRNLDKLMVGKYIGMAPLGYYEKSYRLMMLPLQNITQVISPVMHPVLSSLQNQLEDLTKKYLSILNLLGYLSFPLTGLLFFGAREIVLIVFGNQWFGAVVPFQILSITVGFQLLTSTAGAIYQSANATKKLFESGCWCAFFMVSSYIISIFCFGTIEAVAYGYVVAQLFNTIQCFFLLFKTLNCKLLFLMQSLLKPFIAGLVVFGILWIYSEVCSFNNLVFSLALKSIIFVFSAVLSTICLGEYSVQDLKRIILSR